MIGGQRSLPPSIRDVLHFVVGWLVGWCLGSKCVITNFYFAKKHKYRT
jgi:hypothetical protein